MQEILLLDEESSKTRLAEEIDSVSHVIEESEEMGCAIASTNACGFEVGNIDVDRIIVDEEYLSISFSYSASGEQMDDKPYCGTEIAGSGVAFLDKEGEIEFDDICAGRVEEPDDYE